jgi:hypothetical protein
MRRTLRTRLLMVGVFIGAILALTLSWVFSWGQLSSPEDEQLAAAQVAREKAFHSPPGSCLTWSRVDAADAHLVPCEQPHLFEVTGVLDIGDEYPPGAPSPDVQIWRTIAEQRCVESAQSYLDQPLDPEGRLSMGVLRPDEQQWAKGDRQLRCGLQWAAPGGELQPITGPAAEQDQSDVWEPGTCLALTGKTVGDPIDCAQPHAYEIVATLDLADRFEEGYPSESDQKVWLDTECNKAVKEYSDGADLGEEGLILSWDVRSEASWEAGSTKVNCMVGALLEDESGLAPVTGSIRKPEEPPASSASSKSSAPPSSTGG